jgi:hypothetical protein
MDDWHDHSMQAIEYPTLKALAAQMSGGISVAYLYARAKVAAQVLFCENKAVLS